MCLFCDIYQAQQDIVYENQYVFVIMDHYPVSSGHCLVITKRHISNYFETTHEEMLAIDQAMKHMKKLLDKTHLPDGYNIGINNGRSAGQTIMHLHVHLIPRYQGDHPDPSGGVRAVIAGKQKY